MKVLLFIASAICLIFVVTDGIPLEQLVARPYAGPIGGGTTAAPVTTPPVTTAKPATTTSPPIVNFPCGGGFGGGFGFFFPFFPFFHPGKSLDFKAALKILKKFFKKKKLYRENFS